MGNNQEMNKQTTELSGFYHAVLLLPCDFEHVFLFCNFFEIFKTFVLRT
jgi:hypothetical protein